MERTPSDIGCEHGTGRKLRVREQDVQREVFDEAEKRLPVTAIEELFPGIGDDRSRLLVLSGVDGVRDRADEKAVLGQPVRGAPVELDDPAILVPFELEAEQLAKQAVDLEPVPVTLEPGDEQIGARELPKHLGRVVAPQHRIAKGRGEVGQNGAANEKRASAAIQGGHDLVRQVLAQIPPSGGELTQQQAGIVLVTKPEGGQVHGDRPSLGALDENPDFRIGELHTFGLNQDLASLVGRERQVAGADLAEKSTRAEAAERKGRIGARRGDDPHSRR